MNDKSLLLSLKKGDRDAFEILFKKYASRLYHFSLNFFNNASDAEDIVQEIFLKVWETRSKIDENQNFNTYLISIAKHYIYNLFRHQLVEKKYIEYILRFSANSYSIEHDLAIKNLKELMLSGIELLSPQQKEILLLKNKGYDNEEIALKLNLSKRTVEGHINKAFGYLRVLLTERQDVILSFVIGSLFL